MHWTPSTYTWITCRVAFEQQNTYKRLLHYPFDKKSKGIESLICGDGNMYHKMWVLSLCLYIEQANWKHTFMCRVFKHAEKLSAKRLVLLGTTEWEQGKVSAKDLTTREQLAHCCSAYWEIHRLSIVYSEWIERPHFFLSNSILIDLEHAFIWEVPPLILLQNILWKFQQFAMSTSPQFLNWMLVLRQILH